MDSWIATRTSSASVDGGEGQNAHHIEHSSRVGVRLLSGAIGWSAAIDERTAVLRRIEARGVARQTDGRLTCSRGTGIQMKAIRERVAINALCLLVVGCATVAEPHATTFRVLASPPALSSPPKASPPKVVGLALGTFSSCALSDKGRLRCWGDDRNGVLGHAERWDLGDDELPSAGADVPVGQRISDVACGLLHACAVTQGGDVACWGRWMPVVYPPAWTRRVDLLRLGTPAMQVAAGQSHTCALLASGGLRCWGKGRDGALGYGNGQDVVDREAIEQHANVTVGGRVVQVVAADRLTCALTESGGVRCWGEDAIGYPHKSRVGTDEPPSVMGDIVVGGAVKELAAGGGHVCALLVDGAVRCWGDNAFGDLGYAHQLSVGLDDEPAVAGTVNIGGPVLHLAAGALHTCALLNGGRLRCWGAGEHGRLGYANTSNIGDDETPAAAGDVDVGGEVTQVAAGGFHTCALLKDGCVRCWGLGENGQLGYGNKNNIGDDETPAAAGCVSIF